MPYKYGGTNLALTQTGVTRRGGLHHFSSFIAVPCTVTNNPVVSTATLGAIQFKHFGTGNPGEAAGPG